MDFRDQHQQLQNMSPKDNTEPPTEHSTDEDQAGIGFEIRARKDDVPADAQTETAPPSRSSANTEPWAADEQVYSTNQAVSADQLTESEVDVRAVMEENRRLRSLVNDLRERQRNEAVLGKFMELMRWQDQDSLRLWADRLLNYLVPEVDGIQATMYTVDWEDESQRQLRFLTGYAHGGNRQRIIPFGRGLVGQVALSKRPFLYGDYDEVAAKVPTGILALTATHVYLYPLLHNGEIQGTLEITSLEPLNIHRQELLRGAVERFGTGVHTLRNQLRVERLYEEAAEKSRALEQREAELNDRVEELNRAHAQMHATQEELAKLNAELEARVNERTQKLQKTLNSLQSTQDQLVLSEKMAALGQLVAGVAHEINSPIGAIKASAMSIGGTMADSLRELAQVYKALNSSEEARFDDMLHQVLTAERPEGMDSRATRQRRRAFTEQLTAQGANAAKEMATDLSEAGFEGELAPYMDILLKPIGPDLTQIVYGFGQLRINLDNINLAVDKTKKVVFALKSYAYSRNSSEKTEIDLHQNIETVLTIYHNQLKHGINLTKRLEEVPPVMVYPDELSQVWTNILQNAIQAMNGEGDLLVELYRDDRHAVVAIQDAGPGIPPDNQQKIFEPFFTTKSQGEGTGLGLDICKRIIDKHDGDIKLSSEPGQTRFEIWLPL